MKKTIYSIFCALFICISVNAQDTTQNESVALPANAQIEYKAKVLSTSFTLPIVRINQVNKDATGAPNREVNTAFFNSVGAGIGCHWGRLRYITDAQGQVIDTKFKNTFGIQTGFLFASNSASTTNTNIFAWTVTASILNLQMGWGYEMGSIGDFEKRQFFTLAYNIPIFQLIDGGFFVLKRTRQPVNPNRGLMRVQ